MPADGSTAKGVAPHGVHARAVVRQVERVDDRHGDHPRDSIGPHADHAQDGDRPAAGRRLSWRFLTIRPFHNPLRDHLFLSVPARMLVRMTKSRSSSPYPDPPTGLVRALVRDGWRRAEAEGVQVVWDALRHAAGPDAKTWAARAAAALAKEPVRLAFLHRFADEETTVAVRLLYRGASPEHRAALSALWMAAERKTELEGLEEMRDHLKELRNFPAFDGIFG